MANINSDFTILEQGGQIIIDGDTLLNVPAPCGDCSFTPGLWEVIPNHDRGVLGTAPKQGSQRPTKLSFKAKYRASVTAGELIVILTTAGTSGAAKKFSIVVRSPSVPQGSSGIAHTFAHCVIVPGSLKVSAGEEFDTLEVEFEDMEIKPTMAAYP